jgi:hypothetical protein
MQYNLERQMAVSDKPRRQVCQFGLRSMLIALSLVAVLFARIGYLHQCASFHEREAFRYYRAWQKNHSIRRDTPTLELLESFDADSNQAAKHAEIAQAYRFATYRPWQMVDESNPTP